VVGGRIRVKYKDAGVNIDAAKTVVGIIAEKTKATLSHDVLKGVGPFGAMYRVPLEGMRDPVLVSTIDGVGTKLKICCAMGRHEEAGYDLVSHCANDVLAQGALPLFILDYIAMSTLDSAVVGKIVDGMVRACRECGCSLVGGETAELPETYPQDEYDLVGCMIGIVNAEDIVDGKSITPGDVVIGLPSTGLHTNGYSLARKALLDLRGFALSDRLGELKTTVGDALLAPHRCYVPTVRPLLESRLIKGIAHITGGGLPGNVDRILPKGLGVEIERSSWEIPPIFEVIRREGDVNEDEMYRTFNMGLGLVLVTARDDADRAMDAIAALGEESRRVGGVVESDKAFTLK
jgi:phosphoribosylformylglycinamidine cyclo-ligase